MIKPGYTNRLFKMIPENARSLYEARSGDESAFAELYDVCMGSIYRYIYFLVPDNSVAERLAFKSFITAWEQFENHRRIWESSFLDRLYLIAHDQVKDYFNTHKIYSSPYNEFILSRENSELWTVLQSIKNAIKALPEIEQHTLVLRFILGMPEKTIAHVLRSTLGEVKEAQAKGLLNFTNTLHDVVLQENEDRQFHDVLKKSLKQISKGNWLWGDLPSHFPGYAHQLASIVETVLILRRGCELKPPQMFYAVNHNAFGVYIQSQPNKKQVHILPMLRRSVAIFAVALMALLITGTAHAQTVLPGDPFYGWKRASERAWLALSSDPVTANLTLAERRLNEWIAVAEDPELGSEAMKDYQEMVAYFESLDDGENAGHIISALQSQQQDLRKNGLTSEELNAYLNIVFDTIPATPPVQAGPSDSRPTEPPGQADGFPSNQNNGGTNNGGTNNGNTANGGRNNGGTNNGGTNNGGANNGRNDNGANNGGNNNGGQKK